MNSRLFKICSLLLSIVLLVNMLPLTVWAEEMDTVAKIETQTNVEPAQAEVLGEVTEKRTQYTKDYRLNNGFYVSAVYAEPVHFEEDGQWEEIDNTLKAHADGTYGNTAGVWDVRFPQTLTKDRNVTITKDGYTLSFGMAGELRNQGNLEIASVDGNAAPADIGAADTDAAVVPAPLETASVSLDNKMETFAVSAVQIASAQIINTDDPLTREAAQYEELVLTKTASGLMYNNVYGTTDIQYDLQSNKVKESVILESYDADLRGFRYNLDVGELVPVLNDDGSIDFYDAEEENIVMTMPAPFLIDDAMVTNHDIRVILNGTGSNYTLIYMLPQSWLAAEERAWPVILDPEVMAESTTMNIQDQTVMELKSSDYQWGMLQVGKSVSSGISRVYLGFDNIPNLTSADVIINATVALNRPSSGYATTPVTVHKVNSTWRPENIQWSNKPDFNPIAEDYALVTGANWYYWDVTDIVRGWYTGANTGMMFKATNEIEASASNDSYKQFYSCNYGSYKPLLQITYRNNNGLENCWDYTSSSAGRAGTGHINSYTGNLVWTRTGIGFSGNRMPVSITHVYNLNDNTNIDFCLGNGWRTNYHQRVYETRLTDEICYRWEDEDGTDHYFFHYSGSKYKDEDGLELTLTVNSGSDITRKYAISNKLGETRYFDTLGRLTYIENNQATKSTITITYLGETSPLISQIKDGVNRVYDFTYDLNTGLLSRIDYKGNDGGSYSHVLFAYNNTTNNLIQITDRDGKVSKFGYNSSNILQNAEDIDGYKLSYTYYEPTEARHPWRVQSVSASQNDSAAGSLTLTYAHNQTTFTDHNGNSEIMQFNDYGNTISIQDGLGRAQYAQYALNTSDEAASATSTQKANQMRLSSRLQNTVQNYFLDSSFEDGSAWTVVSGSGSRANSTAQAYMGTHSLEITNDLVIRGGSLSVSPGQTYSFSAYVKTSGASAKVLINNGSQNYIGETLYPNNDWTRLEASYTNTTNSAVTVTARLETSGTGTTYMDCIQGEKMESASRYTLVQNGDFRHQGNNWTGTADYVIAASPAPQLSQNLLKLTGSPTAEKNVTQTISVSGQAGDTYVLAGWGKGDSAVLDTKNNQSTTRQFGIIGTFTYTDGTKRSVTAAFNPDNNTTNAWQYSAQVMVAEKPYSEIEIKVSYDYNINEAYFDGIQLFKEEFGSHYTYDEDGNVITVADAEGEKTQLTYYPNTHDLREEVLPTGLTNSYEYDSYHNVKKITTKNTATGAVQQVQEFTYDACGNLEQQKTTSNDLTLLTKSTYSDDKNHLTSTTDAAGNTTNCWYNTQTSVLEWTQYPNDSIDDSTTTTVREGTATYYGYDTMYRTKTISAVASDDPNVYIGKPNLTADYTYNGHDLLTKIETSSTTYNFGYGNFGLRTSVKAGNTLLASYEYTNDQNHYLQKQTFGNGDYAAYTYDQYGRPTSTTHEDNSTVKYLYDNNGDLTYVYDSSTGLTTRYSYDFTGRTGATEVLDGHNLLFRVSEKYDAHNRPTSQTRQFDATRYTDTYTYNADGTLQTLVLGNIRGIGYDYDGLKRITAMNTGTDGNTGPNGRTFTYVPVDDPNFAGNTTGQIKTIRYDELMAKRGYSSFDFEYEYDKNGNISEYTSPVETIEYTYDTQNQLLRANNTGNGMVFSYTYDDAGNILTAKKGSTTYTYEYTNADWGDLLTKYNGTSISYDAIGNPLSYYNGWNFTWQQGREMATATKGSQSLSFTYDADGIRRTKTVNGVTHTYYYVGGKLARETYGSNVLDFFYDQNGHPFMMVYNGTVYYYVTNAQGDVIRVTDVLGQTAARYQYDPYGNIIDSAGSHVDINPLRYRGYYYDKESGLYYLQSRYYDPNIGRFINADYRASTKKAGLGCNLFAYCSNNAINFYDPNGFDAIWIQEGNSAVNFGHSGLMVQDDNGNWFFFYWGPQDETPSIELVTGVENGSYIQAIDSNGANMQDLETLRSTLAASGGKAGGRASKITDIYYFEGDYTATLDAVRCMVESEEEYKLLTNNCVQKTLTAFSLSDGRFGMVSYGMLNSLIPNRTAMKVSMLPARKSEFPWQLALINMLE